ncbi:MAG: alpha/beta hydrolase family protein [Steroidobacteraceae bacterium]
MAQLRKVFGTRYGHVHLRLSEGQGPPLVLLHGAARSSRLWERLQARIGRATIAVDRLGFGFSDAPPWALTMEEFARCTLDALDAGGVGESFDVLGVHSGSLEAVEIAHLAAPRVRKLVLAGVPLFDAAERARALARLAEQGIRPAEDGSHLLAAWRAQFAYRQPPYDLMDAQDRLLDFLLAPNPGADYRAVCGYDAERRIRQLKVPMCVLAIHDDLLEQTARITPLIKEGDSYVDLPGQSVDAFSEGLDVMIDLLNQHLPR